jgi:WhiB family redox-sensing transcriptional regulator
MTATKFAPPQNVVSLHLPRGSGREWSEGAAGKVLASIGEQKIRTTVAPEHVAVMAELNRRVTVYTAAKNLKATQNEVKAVAALYGWIFNADTNRLAPPGGFPEAVPGLPASHQAVLDRLAAGRTIRSVHRRCGITRAEVRKIATDYGWTITGERAYPPGVATPPPMPPPSAEVVQLAKLLPYVWTGYLDPSEPDADWRDRALCAQTDPEEFFPEKGGSSRQAKKVCASCEVRAQCLEYALQHDERFGVWGGLSERERRRLKREAM